MAVTFVKLTKKHDVKDFDSGNDDLNSWFATTAGQHQRKGLSVTTFLVDDKSPRDVIGFHTVAVRGLMQKGDFPPEIVKQLPRQFPCFTIARLAVSKHHQNKGHGEMLLVDAMKQVKRASRDVGGVLLFVDAKDEEIAHFYQRYGFLALPDDPTTLVMLVADIPDTN
jgi:ribosomal protein S18 acetylase RimI-like enzyme